MKKALFGAALFYACVICYSRDAAAFPLEIVNWGGDYVTASQNLQTLNPDSINGLDLDGDLANDDARTGRNYNRTSTYSPGSNYSGTSGVFSGGASVGQLDVATSAGLSTARIWQAGVPGDSIEFQRGATTVASQIHAVVLWDQDNFLGVGPSSHLSIDATSSFSISITSVLGSDWQGRWLVEEGGQLYLSETTFNPGANGTYDLTFGDTNDGNWAAYNPSGLALNFDQSGATYSARNFSDITAVGFYVERDSFATNASRTRVTNFSATLQTPEPGSLALLGLGAAILALRRRKK
ncbi:MAG TPA: PEP-CTERM sorting domain-containing protein [Candidatus Brocadiia bacterium]|nr:PEP-CTERM sorting domain-containing protein [Candidatus Brocadiia bacterium]